MNCIYSFTLPIIVKIHDVVFLYNVELKKTEALFNCFICERIQKMQCMSTALEVECESRTKSFASNVRAIRLTGLILDSF